MKRQWSKPVLKPMTAEEVAWFQNVMRESAAKEQVTVNRPVAEHETVYSDDIATEIRLETNED